MAEAMFSVFRVWLECNGKHIIGKGGVEILQAIEETGSLTKAAEKAKMSYKYLWDYLTAVEKNLGQPVVRTRKGGSFGGGGAELTEAGRALLREYRRVDEYLRRTLENPEPWEAIGLKISARNRLKGRVKKVAKGVVTASVKIEVEGPVTLTAVITKEAAEELKLKPGDRVYGVVKATEVMIAKE